MPVRAACDLRAGEERERPAEQLAELAQLLDRSDTAIAPALSGQDGIGKTELSALGAKPTWHHNDSPPITDLLEASRRSSQLALFCCFRVDGVTAIGPGNI
jgi:hypothetical protein